MLNDFWLSADPKASRLYCCMPSVPPTSRRPVTTPGTRPAITHGLRPVGIESYSSLVMLVCVVFELTSTTGAAPLTVTVSCSVPTPSSTSRRVVRFTCTITSCRFWGVKPPRS